MLFRIIGDYTFNEIGANLAAPVWLLLRSMMSGTRVVASSTGIRFPEDNDGIDPNADVNGS